jgi:antitoxin (DNA-binding transcriptional repressor) of toxin-antitoxin stability system
VPVSLADELVAPPEPPPGVEVLPEVPAWLLEAPVVDEPPRCECGAEVFPGPLPEEEPRFCFTRAPELLADRFAVEWLAVQRATARMWRAAAAMHAAAGASSAEFVGDDLALLTNTHPRSGAALLVTAVGVCEVPELLALVEAGELSSRHAVALLEEAGRWAAGDGAQQADLVRATLERCRARVDAGHGWPTPGQLKKHLATVAVLGDLSAAEKLAKTVAERRGVSSYPTGAGAAALTIEGPQTCVGQMHEAIRARAEAMGKVPGETRSLAQRMHDAALELLTVDADGGPSAVATTGEDGQPVTLTVRGVQVALIVPVSVATGGELELAEIPGLGPVLPSTARELLAHADTVQRVTVDTATGQVLTVDDPVPGPGPAAPDDPVQVLLEQVVQAPVVIRDLSSDAYRPPDRLRRHVERRDRTCTFPGCTVPGQRCDVDHREPWPHGRTSEANCHCLCRRHHRAKQGYFTVELDPDGSTVWTTPDGRQHRRPPPTYRPAVPALSHPEPPRFRDSGMPGDPRRTAAACRSVHLVR